MKDTAFEGKIMDILVKDGVLQLNCMEQTRMSQEQVFAQCRYEQIDNLGKVQRAYLEANGGFTILKFDSKKPGLSILPAWDNELITDQQAAPGTYACANCGHVIHDKVKKQASCELCSGNEWKNAVFS